MAKNTGITFTCTDCGEELPLADLSEYSLAEAESSSRPAALLALAADDIICTRCDERSHDWDEDEVGERLGMSDGERFIFSGLDYIDPARLQAYRLNY